MRHKHLFIDGYCGCGKDYFDSLRCKLDDAYYNPELAPWWAKLLHKIGVTA